MGSRDPRDKTRRAPRRDRAAPGHDTERREIGIYSPRDELEYLEDLAFKFEPADFPEDRR